MEIKSKAMLIHYSSVPLFCLCRNGGTKTLVYIVIYIW